MFLTENQAKRASKHGVWVDYYTGKPRVSDYRFIGASNNWSKMHGLPMRRRFGNRKRKKRKRAEELTYENCKEIINAMPLWDYLKLAAKLKPEKMNMDVLGGGEVITLKELSDNKDNS